MENNPIPKKRIIREAFIASLPVMAGYIVLGIGFGILFAAKGYGPLWALAMSLFVYAGSLQYVAIDLIASGAGLIAVALTALMVNARHLFYGISMVDRYKGAGAKKPYMIFALTDETYSLVCTDSAPGHTTPLYYFSVSAFNQCYWVAGSLIGSIIGTVFSFNAAGLDFALTALFVTVATDQWISTKDHRSAITGAVVSILCVLIFGPSNFLIPAMIGITVVLTILKYIPAKGEKKDV